MKKILFAFLLVFSTVGTSNAVQCSFSACEYGSGGNVLLDCADTRSMGCIDGEEIFTCDSCYSGSVRTSVTGYGASCSYTYYVCEETCTGCTNCTDDVSWSSFGTGYQKYTERYCDCNTCNETTSYRCANGYYGTTLNGSTGCSACVPFGTSTAGSNSLITSCYLPTTYAGADPTGTFSYSQNCYYSN